MAGTWTNRGAYRVVEAVFNGTSLPTNFYFALVTDTPTRTTNTLSELTQIANGNGYDATAGGLSFNRNSTDFPTLVEDDTSHFGSAEAKDIVWTASGGPIPASGSNGLYLVMTDDNVTVSSREVWAFWGPYSPTLAATAGNSITLQDARLRLLPNAP